MKDIILCFHEEVYGERLGTFIRKNYQQAFRILGTVPKKDFQKRAGMLLLTDDWELHCQMPKEESCFFDFDNKGEGICPFQPADGIVASLLWNGNEKSELYKGGEGHLTVFYTPGGSSSQKEAALKRCKELGKSGKALYIPVRDMEGRECDDEIFYDLSELCYLMKKNEKISTEKLLAAIEQGEEVHCLRGFHSPIHLGELGREISGLVELIGHQTDYVYLVLDLQILPPDYETLFLHAEELYSVEDGSPGEDYTLLYKWIKKLKDELKLKDEVCKVWKWGEDDDASNAFG